MASALDAQPEVSSRHIPYVGTVSSDSVTVRSRSNGDRFGTWRDASVIGFDVNAREQRAPIHADGSFHRESTFNVPLLHESTCSLDDSLIHGWTHSLCLCSARLQQGLIQ